MIHKWCISAKPMLTLHLRWLGKGRKTEIRMARNSIKGIISFGSRKNWERLGLWKAEDKRKILLDSGSTLQSAHEQRLGIFMLYITSIPRPLILAWVSEFLCVISILKSSNSSVVLLLQLPDCLQWFAELVKFIHTRWVENFSINTRMANGRKN